MTPNQKAALQFLFSTFDDCEAIVILRDKERKVSVHAAHFAQDASGMGDKLEVLRFSRALVLDAMVKSMKGEAAQLEQEQTEDQVIASLAPHVDIPDVPTVEGAHPVRRL